MSHQVYPTISDRIVVNLQTNSDYVSASGKGAHETTDRFGVDFFNTLDRL